MSPWAARMCREKESVLGADLVKKRERNLGGAAWTFREV